MGKKKTTEDPEEELNDDDYTKPRKYDPKFRGPIENRSCTDVLCCIIFIVFFLGLLVVAAWAFAFGDVRKILYPTDSDGKVCGIGPLKDRPKLVFFDLLTCLKMGTALLSMGCPTPQVCVKNCPRYYWNWNVDQDRSKMICKGGVDGNDLDYVTKPVSELIRDSDCAPYVLDSRSVFGRCMPAIITDILNQTLRSISDKKGNTVNGTIVAKTSQNLRLLQAAQVAQNVIQDLYTSLPYIATGLGIAVLLSLFYTLLLRYLAKVMVWLMLFLFVALFAALTTYSFYRWFTLRSASAEQQELFMAKHSVSNFFAMANTWLGFGIASGIILLIVLLILIFLRSRIQIAIALINQASKAVGHMMSTLLWPIIPFLLQVLVLVIFLSVLILLMSVRSPEGVRIPANYSLADNMTLEPDEAAQEELQNLASKLPCDPSVNSTAGSVCHFVKYGGRNYITVLQIYNAFMFFWLFNFVIGLGQMTLAGAFASYYFAFVKPKDIPALPLLSSVGRSLRYHLGSIAFGSLLIALVQLIRLFLEYIDAKARASQNIVAQFFLKCLKCCFWCLEKFLKFLTKNAYIMVAVYGYNFCTGAKNAFNLILRNLVRVVVVDKVTNFVLFVGKLVVVGLIGALSYFFFDGTLSDKVDFLKKIQPTLNYFYIPVILLVIFSYIIASLFYSVYDMAVDTIFLCFLEDLERNDGSPEKPYYMSKELMKILSKKNKPDESEMTQIDK